jgi:hypothetical protein
MDIHNHFAKVRGNVSEGLTGPGQLLLRLYLSALQMMASDFISILWP